MLRPSKPASKQPIAKKSAAIKKAVAKPAVKTRARKAPIKNAARQQSIERASPARLRMANGLKLARQRAGLTQSELAQIVGILQNDLSYIENGKQNITIDTLDRFANALGCPIKDFF